MVTRRLEINIESRPWGSFSTYAENAQATIKTIEVQKGEALSLQYHRDREEIWFFVSGIAQVTLGDETRLENAGSIIHIPRETIHRIETVSDVKLVEVSLGEFDENDIVRLSDRYGRRTVEDS